MAKTKPVAVRKASSDEYSLSKLLNKTKISKSKARDRRPRLLVKPAKLQKVRMIFRNRRLVNGSVFGGTAGIKGLRLAGKGGRKREL
jgi:hypothetical protein